MVANRVPFEIYGRYPQKLNPDPGVVDGFGVDITPIGHGTLSSMTTLVLDKVHLFTLLIPMDKLWTFHFLKKVTYGVLDKVKNWMSF